MPTKPSAPKGYKIVLVVRGELRLTPGKAAVQVAHASVMLYQLAEKRQKVALDAWLSQGQKKIAVIAPTLTDMEEIERRAKARGVPSVVVEDAGLTEVAPGTRTVLGLGPAPSEELDRLTGSLALL